jgi:hypothetical protein
VIFSKRGSISEWHSLAFCIHDHRVVGLESCERRNGHQEFENLYFTVVDPACLRHPADFVKG